MIPLRNLEVEYLSEEIDFGGHPTPRGEVIQAMWADGHTEHCIHMWVTSNAADKTNKEERERLEAAAASA